MRELGAIVRTGSCFCCTQNAGFPDIPRPQHDNVFCRGISPLFNWSACRQLWFLHNGDRCRPFLWLFWWSSDKWASGPGLKALILGDGIHQPPYEATEATEYGDHSAIGHPKLTGYLMTSPTILYIWQLLGFWSDRPFQNRVPQNASVQNPMAHSKSDWHIAKNDQDLASLDIPGLKNDSLRINHPQLINHLEAISLHHPFRTWHEVLRWSIASSATTKAWWRDEMGCFKWSEMVWKRIPSISK